MDSGEAEKNELQPLETHKTYTYEGAKGWRQYRISRPGRGMYHDVRRRLPFYWSDITDALTYRTFASTVRMYFVNLLPAIAFTLDMTRRTGYFFGINETLFASALAAMVFSILACQPLTIVGITGLISLFNYTTYDIIEQYDVSLYPRFMAWVGIWGAIFHWIVSFFNYCDYMKYITDFSSESFGMYVGIIYMVKGVEELVNEFSVASPAAGFMATMIAILYFGSVYGLEKLGSSTLWKPWFRGILADYAYIFPTLFWVGFSHIRGTLRDTDVTYVPIHQAFHPSTDRSWLVDFWNLPVTWVFVALPFGFLLMLLFYYDHNVSSLTAQARQFPLKKPAGFHWDFFLLGCTTFVAGILGLPLPNGLVPQAPVHTDSLTVYETSLEVMHTQDEDGEKSEIRKPMVEATAVVEQRLSHFLMGLGLIGTMTGPLLIVLSTMPAAVFAGVFFVVGWGSIETNGILAKVLFLQSETRFIQPSNPLATIKRRKIALYVGLQILGVAVTVAISQTIAAIGFPVLIIALIPLRTFVMPKWFTRRELDTLDDLTANNKAVLASLGGRPEMDGDDGEEVEDESWRREEGMDISYEGHGQGVDMPPCIAPQPETRRERSRSTVRQRAGSITRQTLHKTISSQSRNRRRGSENDVLRQTTRESARNTSSVREE